MEYSFTGPARKYMSLANCRGASGSESAGNLSSGSNNQTSSGSGGDTSLTTSSTTEMASLKPPTLTESLLSKHNEDMEKQLVQRHRQIRSTIKSDKLKESRSKSAVERTSDPTALVNQSLKRCGSPTRKGDKIKVIHCEFDIVDLIQRFADELTSFITLDIKMGEYTKPKKVETNCCEGGRCWSSNGGRSSKRKCQYVDFTLGRHPPDVHCFSTKVSVVTVTNVFPLVACNYHLANCVNLLCSMSPQISTMYPTVTQMIPIYYFPATQNRLGPTCVPQEHPGPPPQVQSTSQSPYSEFDRTYSR